MLGSQRQFTWPMFLIIGLGLVPVRAAAADEETTPADEHLLRQARVKTDTAGVLAFFRQRTLTAGGRQRLQNLLEQLGSPKFAAREKARKELIRQGPPALPGLRQALGDTDLEIARRARMCIEEIERGPGSVVAMAAVRMLVRHRPAQTVEVLLRYLPFADDGEVEEAVLEALREVAASGSRPAPCLVAALGDAHPARRAAAGFVLGRRHWPELRQATAKLLMDADARVRYRTAQAMLAAGRKEAVPALIELLAAGPMEIAGRAEELLLRLAGDGAPLVPTSGNAPAERQAWRNAWAQWWDGAGTKIDMARANARSPFLNLILVPEMHANQIWECGWDGKPRWKLTDLQQPIDAHVLPGGRLLIAELKAGQVTERDRTGKIFWKFTINQPASCQRLPNGNTFIGTTQRVLEITPAGKEVFSYAPGNGFTTNGYHRLRNGNVVLLSITGQIREISPAQKVVRSFQIPQQGRRNWCGIEVLPHNHYLVADCAQGEVHEVDAAGKTVWKATQAAAYFATRLPSGNVLVAHGGGIAEITRAGRVVRRIPVRTGSWLVHWR